MGKCCLHASSFILIESSSKLPVTRTGINAWMCLVSGRIRQLTLQLLALEWRKFYTFKLEYLWGQLANLDQILYVALLGVGKGCIMFWGRLDAKWTIAPPLLKIQDKQRLFSVHFIRDRMHVYLFVLSFFHGYVILTGQSNLSVNFRVRLNSLKVTM